MKNSSALLCALVATLSLAPAAFAASNTSEAIIDWSAVEYSFVLGSGQVDFSTFTSYADSYAYVYDGTSSNYQYGNPLTLPGLSGSGIFAPDTFTATTTATYAAYDGHRDDIYAYAGYQGTITLEAGAIVRLKVPYSISAAVGIAGNDEYGSASAYLTLYDGKGRSYSSQASVYANSWQISGSGKDDLYLLVENRSGAVQDYQLVAQAYTSAGSAVAAVPEPETYAMLLAGLGMVGMIARRRRQTLL